jgi:hypothetical protein
MDETRNETNRLPVACDECQVPSGLTFRFRGGFADPGGPIGVLPPVNVRESPRLDPSIHG